MKLKEIIKGVEVKVVGSSDVEVDNIQFDSRQVTRGTLFVAQRGTKVDGHAFIERTVEDGAVAVVCEELPMTLRTGVTYVQVSNSSCALGQMAANFYGHPSEKLKLIGITGTNGKTTIVTLLHRMFRMLGIQIGRAHV